VNGLRVAVLTLSAMLATAAMAAPSAAQSCSPEILAQRNVMHDILADVAERGLRGAHHYSITFLTSVEGVTLPAPLRAQYPKEMSIILQYQFERLVVRDDRFAVVLAFKGRKQRLVVPFNAITLFIDPSVDVRMQFDPATAAQWCGKADRSPRPA
jgi:hypothetical protein